MQQARLEGIAVHVLEPSGNTSLQVANTVLEKREELVRLVALNLTVLDGLAAERLVELHGLVRSHSHLILGRLSAQPEVNVVLQRILAGLEKHKVNQEESWAVVTAPV